MVERKKDAEGQTGLVMSYEDSCNRIPTLWIHGFPLNNLLWDLQVDGLAHMARLITPDLRGHGLTEPSEPPCSMKGFADDCAQLLDHLGIEGPVVVAGLSMGGYVALEFYRRYPESVAGLILAATRAGADSEEARLARDAAAATATAEGIAPIVEGMLPKLMAPNTYGEQPDLGEFVEEMMMQTSTEGMVGALAAMRDRADSTPHLDKIKVPCLVLHGEEDQLIPLSEARLMQESIEGAELVVVPGAGHLPNLEQPELFNEAVLVWLEQFYE